MGKRLDAINNTRHFLYPIRNEHSLDCLEMVRWEPVPKKALPEGGPMSPVWILKRLVSVFINACRLLSALPSLLQFGWGRLSLVAISFYALSPLFGPCRLSEFTLTGPPEGLFRPSLKTFVLPFLPTWQTAHGSRRMGRSKPLICIFAIFLMEQSCAVPISKVESHALDRCSYIWYLIAFCFGVLIYLV